MLLTESVQPFQFVGGSTDAMDRFRTILPGGSTHSRRAHSRSLSSYSSISSSGGLRLADVAKQHGMGVHVENWREDAFPVRQYLPMQHIIGSLKRDRDEQVRYLREPDMPARRQSLFSRQSEVPAVAPGSKDSFVQLLRMPKRRRTSGSSHAESQCTVDSDPDRRFSYQSAEHTAKDIPQSALPGLNHLLNLATITSTERDILSEYAPKQLDDPQLLMSEVLQLRERMTNEDEKVEEEDGWNDNASTVGARSPIIPPDRDAEVREAFESFVDLDGHGRFLAKI